MNVKLTTTKISPKALRTLRIVSDLTGEKQYRLLERVLLAELNHVKKHQEPEQTEQAESVVS